MIEEIKIEIKEHIQHLEKIDGQNIPLKDNFEFCSMNELYQTGKYSAFKDVLEILDKYNNQEKQTTIFIDTEDIEERYGTNLYIDYLENYKNAWEELKAIYNHNDDKSKNEIMVLGKIREVEEKHNIGGVE